MKTKCLLLLFCVCITVLHGQEQDEYGFLLFNLNESTFVRPELASAQLDELAQRLLSLELRSGQIHVVGYAAKVDNHINEWRLSRERAQTVINELIMRNIPEQFFAPAEGLGSTFRWGDNRSEQERRRNRRVIILVDKPIPEISVDTADVEGAEISNSQQITESTDNYTPVSDTVSNSYILITPPLEGMTEESTISDYEKKRQEIISGENSSEEYAGYPSADVSSENVVKDVNPQPGDRYTGGLNASQMSGRLHNDTDGKAQSIRTEAEQASQQYPFPDDTSSREQYRSAELLNPGSRQAEKSQNSSVVSSGKRAYSFSSDLLGFAWWMLTILGIVTVGVIIWSFLVPLLCGKSSDSSDDKS